MERDRTTADDSLSLSLSVRPAVADDFVACHAIDHRFRTARVWQIDLAGSDHQRSVRFQVVRLPRRITIEYPFTREEMVERWCEADLVLVAEDGDYLAGYLTAVIDRVEPLVWLNDIVVAPEQRRQGVGSDLLARAAHWTHQKRLHRLMAKVPTKNEPAIRFLEKNGFSFCGYNEYHYQHEEIALYFTLKL